MLSYFQGGASQPPPAAPEKRRNSTTACASGGVKHLRGLGLTRIRTDQDKGLISVYPCSPVVARPARCGVGILPACRAGAGPISGLRWSPSDSRNRRRPRFESLHFRFSTTPAKGASPPHLRSGAFRNSPPESGGDARSRRGGFRFCVAHPAVIVSLTLSF
jgi:hypothetical protein